MGWTVGVDSVRSNFKIPGVWNLRDRILELSLKAGAYSNTLLCDEPVLSFLEHAILMDCTYILIPKACTDDV